MQQKGGKLHYSNMWKYLFFFCFTPWIPQTLREGKKIDKSVTKNVSEYLGFWMPRAASSAWVIPACVCCIWLTAQHWSQLPLKATWKKATGRVLLGGNGDQALSKWENLRSALLGSGVGQCGSCPAYQPDPCQSILYCPAAWLRVADRATVNLALREQRGWQLAVEIMLVTEQLRGVTGLLSLGHWFFISTCSQTSSFQNFHKYLGLGFSSPNCSFSKISCLG